MEKRVLRLLADGIRLSAYKEKHISCLNHPLLESCKQYRLDKHTLEKIQALLKKEYEKLKRLDEEKEKNL